MIPSHARFLEAIQERKKVSVRFYSAPDSGVVDRICAPLDYGPGGEFKDGLNRYWLWDYAGATDTHTLGLVPQQIVELQVLGEVFDPAEFGAGPWQWAIPREWSSKAPVSEAPAAVSATGQGAEPATTDQGEAAPLTVVAQTAAGPVQRFETAPAGEGMNSSAR